MSVSPSSSPATSKQAVVLAFSCFALAYFLTYGLRSVNATLAPFITADLGLTDAQLGGLSAVFFLGLAVMQMPLGVWLDRYGARRVECALLLVAVLGSVMLALAPNDRWFIGGRILLGVGVSACLMAPFSYFRRCFPAGMQAQLALWLLVAGSSGSLLFTVPVELMAGAWGWRTVHGLSALSLVICTVVLWIYLKDDDLKFLSSAENPAEKISLLKLLVHPLMLRVGPASIALQGGAMAVLSLWAGPWLMESLGMNSAQSSRVLLGLMTSIALGYLLMGVLRAWLQKRFSFLSVIFACFMLHAVVVLLIALWRSPSAWWLWLVFGVSLGPWTLMQPLLVSRFPKAVAGKVATLYNMLVFIGAFLVQWGIGAMIDVLSLWVPDRAQAFQLTLLGLGVLQGLAALQFLKVAIPAMRKTRVAD